MIQCFSLYSQGSLKHYQTKRIEIPPHIDGLLDDESWAHVPGQSDFMQTRPIEGAVPTMRTEFKIVYDDFAIYVGAMMYDSHPDSILHELSLRDGFDPSSPQNYISINADLFRFVIDPYNLRQDAFDFGVYASGVQADSKFSDQTFDAVWESAVKINEKGWAVEMKIPYSAIRFPKKNVQEWALQITRNVRRSREFDQWNLTPSGAFNSELFWGTLQGIEMIKLPLRLSLTPFISGAKKKFPMENPGNTIAYQKASNYNFGADVKYGISESFTLDMTLLPDFNQVQSDSKIKSLGYEEIIYNENRTFFKEATDIFNKGNLFYSRRIGKQPSGFYDIGSQLDQGESIIDNPSQVKLINAVKVSGRNNNGLGIGFFNAITDKMFAKIKKADGTSRSVLTEPFSNYNIMVIDKQIKSSSNIYFINTSVIRDMNFNHSNVSGTGFTFANKSNTYALDGNGALSKIIDKRNLNTSISQDPLGYQYFLGCRKISGRIQAGVSYSGINPNYNQSDFGSYVVNNRERSKFYVEYYQFKPSRIFRDSYLATSYTYGRHFVSKKRTFNEIDFNANGTLLDYKTIFGGGGITPMTSDDYDPRLHGAYAKSLRYFYFYAGFSTDYRKRLAVDLTQNVSNFIDKFVFYGYNTDLGIRFRLNNRFTINYKFAYYFDPFNYGYIDGSNDLYGGRKLNTFENRFSLRYLFSPNMSLSVSGRHYWLTARYLKYFNLSVDGEDIEIPDQINKFFDFSYNVLNIDVIYSWHFAPGSDLSFVYKNAVDNFAPGEIVSIGYNKNFHDVLGFPRTSLISMKVLYYLDYSYFRKKQF